ncbi:MAG TPA: 2-C-methyl-D-erythritol 4-phosphate cytidylyltransferase [Solirubrobacterales bacterium]|nr:2-C-methyl-D-erythritol 4-phosphate cytidylyltransferase [Solirubrobacterales bacterium]
MPSVTAVVAAAGSGERLGAGGPKAFVPVAGKRLIEWSLAALRAAPSVGAIVVACPPGRAGELEDGLGELENGLSGAGLSLVEGGATRADSVANGLALVETELVAIHDAARPLLTPELVEGVVGGLVSDPDADAAIAAAPLTDTIKRGGSNVEETVDRALLWAAQTPQVFRTEALRRAIDSYPADAPEPTDEAMLIEAAGGRVLIHSASPENLKVTTPLDLRVAELLLADRVR